MPGISDPALFNQLMQQDFSFFVRWAFGLLHPVEPMLENWHVDAICHQLALVQQGCLPRLVINLPPRFLKSLIVTVAYPAWLLGNNPAARIISASYSDDLSRAFSRQFRRLIEDQHYRSAFPGMRIDQRKNNETEIGTTASGFRLATSVGGTLTGRGAGLIIVDDPIKAGDAMSKAERERVNEWFDGALVSRLDDQATSAIIIVMQRVHEDDLSGHVLRKPGYRHLNLPAHCLEKASIELPRGKRKHWAENEPLHAARLDMATQQQLMQEMGERNFSAQYLQAPRPKGGAIFKEASFRFYETLPYPDNIIETVQSWDVASKTGNGNDYSACTTWAVCRDRVYWLVDVARRRLELPDLVGFASQFAERHGARRILVEDAGSGVALIQELRRGSMAAIDAIRPVGDKVTRAESATIPFETGRVWLPRRVDPDWQAFAEELLAFPGGRHDDQVDSVSQFLNWAEAREHRSYANMAPIEMTRVSPWKF